MTNEITLTDPAKSTIRIAAYGAVTLLSAAGVAFATRSKPAEDMMTAAVAAQVPATWAAADEAYGNNTRLRCELRKVGLGHVLAVSRDHLLPLDGGKSRRRADLIAGDLPAINATP